MKSSAFRILFTLKEAGYVEQPEMNGVDRLSLKTASLARRNANRLGLATVARPHLALLREKLDESVALAERLAESVVLIDVLETSHPLRLTLPRRCLPDTRDGTWGRRWRPSFHQKSLRLFSKSQNSQSTQTHLYENARPEVGSGAHA